MTYVSGDLRDQLAYVGSDVVRAGLVVGSGGNLSARTSDGDACWVTATGTWLDRLDRRSFARVRISDGAVLDDDGAVLDDDGAVLDDGRVPTSELALHLATYRARPDVRSVVHLHPQTVLLLDAAGERVRLITTDHVFYLREVVTTPFRAPGTPEVASDAAAAVVGGVNCVILAHHGCSVLGDSVELAHKRARNLEEAAQLTYRALAAGLLPALRDCPEEFARRIAAGGTITV